MFDTYAGGLWPRDTDDRDRPAVADHRCAVAPVPGGLNRLMRTVRAVRVEPAAASGWARMIGPLR
jgi:hypothetical protein